MPPGISAARLMFPYIVGTSFQGTNALACALVAGDQAVDLKSLEDRLRSPDLRFPISPRGQTIIELPRAEFEEVAMPLLDSLYRTARRMTGNAEDAEDLVQESMMRAYRAWKTFIPGSNARAWIFKILVNTYINRYRKKKIEPRTTSLEDAEEFFFYNQIDRQRDEHILPSAEEEALSRLVDDDVKQAIESLPEHYRVAVLLADVEDFSYREIAEVTGVKIGTVMSRLARGRRLLQKRLWSYAMEQGIVGAKAGS